MTVLAARLVNRGSEPAIQLATDSQRTVGNQKHPATKIHTHDDMVYAIAGEVPNATHFRHFLREHRVEEMTEAGVYDLMVKFHKHLKAMTGDWPKVTNHFLLIKDMRIFTCYGLTIMETKNYAAVGSGSDFALAILEAGLDAEAAVRSACKFDLNCSGPIQIADITAKNGVKLNVVT